MMSHSEMTVRLFPRLGHFLKVGTALFVLSTAAFPSPVQATPPQTEKQSRLYHAETMNLKNGMQVVVIPNHRAPVVTHMVWYKVGSADEPQGDGISGAAHFLEHLMFKGTKAIPAGDFSKIIRGMGGEDNAFTSWDYTSYFQSVAKDQLPRVMAMEADRMINITLPEKEIESEREVIIEERRMRVENDPQSLFSEQMRAVLFQATPYGEPIIGWHHEMPKLKRDHVLQYYKTWYTPKNAILVISGDVTLQEVAPLAEKYYGIIPSHDVPDHVRPETPAFASPVTLRFESDQIRQPVFLRAWRAPSYITNKQEALALDLLMEVLDGGSSTEMYQSLVVRDKKATSISLSFEGDSRGEGSIWLTATPAPHVSLEELQAAIEKKFQSLIEAGLSQEEINKAKTRFTDHQDYARDSVMGPAMDVGQSLAYGLTLDDVETRTAQVTAVEKSKVDQVMKKYLSPQSPQNMPVTGLMIPHVSSADATKGGKK